ncbi:MAG TPA: nickel-binding protein [Albitalea sp.]|uniref:nickel-binding protein n=1 Tax=Piscinibacter sp. TaxID=1903157 RepID=UPI002ED5038C
MARIVVERNFETPQSDADMKAVADRERPCLAAYQVTWKRSLISADHKRMVCEYEASDAETLRRIQREAGAQFDRVWVGEVIE